MIKKLFIIILILLFAVPAFGATWTTDVTQAGGGGSCIDGGECSIAEFNALTGSHPDSVFSFSGTFTTAVTPQIYGTSGHALILDGYKTDDTTYMSLSEVTGRAKIDRNGGSICININGPDYVTIQDFEMTDCIDIALAIHGGSHDILAKRNYIHTLAGKGIEFYEAAYNVTIGGTLNHGNVVKNVGTTTAHYDVGMSGSHDNIVSYNHLYADDTNYGIDGVIASDGAIYSVLIEYNSIHNHNRSTNGEDGFDIKKADTRDIIIRYNHIYDHTYQSCGTVQSGSHEVYVYGNRCSDSENGFITGDDPANNNVYFFSNIIYDIEEKALAIGAQGSAGNVWIFNNTLAENGNCTESLGVGECRAAGSATAWGNLYMQNVTASIIKNNIFYKGRPNDNNYEQMYVGTSMDTLTTSDYNWYYWPAQTSTIFWGDAGSLTVDQVQAGAGNGLPQEAGLLANEGDPGLTDIANNDYTIASGAAVIGAGVDMGTGAIDTITIQGVSYPIYWDTAILTATWGSGSTLPVITTTTRDSYDAWDIGAYQSGGPIISGAYPTSQQECASDPQTVEIGVTSSSNCNCKYSAKGVDTCSTTFANLDTSFTGGEGGTAHTKDVSQACDGSTVYVVKCQDTVTSLISNCVEITVDVAASGGAPPQPAPTGIVTGGNVSIVPGGNVSIE